MHLPIISIQTEKPYYYAGQLVKGVISVVVHTPFPLDEIVLKLKGLERSHFFYARTVHHSDRNSRTGSTHTYSNTVYEPVYDAKDFFKHKVRLVDKKCTFLPGRYEFPFEVALPLRLPGSLDMNTGSSLSGREWAALRHRNFMTGQAETFVAQVLYKIKVEIWRPRCDPIKFHQVLHIHEPLAKPLAAHQTLKEGRISFLCCIPRGRATLSATYEKNAYAPGETIVLNAFVDNREGLAKLPGMCVRLYRRLALRGQGQGFERVRVIGEANVEVSIGPGTFFERGFSVPSIPHDAPATTHGQLVVCEYWLEACLRVPWSPDLTVKCPVQIYVPSLAEDACPSHSPCLSGSLTAGTKEHPVLGLPTTAQVVVDPSQAGGASSSHHIPMNAVAPSAPPMFLSDGAEASSDVKRQPSDAESSGLPAPLAPSAPPADAVPPPSYQATVFPVLSINSLDTTY